MHVLKFLLTLTATAFVETSAFPFTPQVRPGGKLIHGDPPYGTATTVAFGRGSLNPYRTAWSPTFWIYPKKSKFSLYN
jgi:hypothetical protein